MNSKTDLVAYRGFLKGLALTLFALLAGTLVFVSNSKNDEGTLSKIFETSNSVMWVGPHPDDELFVAGTLGHLCKDLNYNCTIVAFGENPDLIEGNKQSAQFLNADYIRLPDIMGKTNHNCGGKKNSGENINCIVESWIKKGIKEELVKIVNEKKPDIVFTFEPESTIEVSQTHVASSMVAKQAIEESKVNPHHYYVIQTPHLAEKDFDKDKSKATDVIELTNKLWSYKMEVIGFYSFYYPSLEQLIDDQPYQQSRLHKEVFREVN
ncbi:MAG: PIG-L family deacetylase [bacterium]